MRNRLLLLLTQLTSHQRLKRLLPISLFLCAIILGAQAASLMHHASLDIQGASTYVVTKTKVHQRWHRTEVEVLIDDSVQGLGLPISDVTAQAYATWNNSGAELPTIYLGQTSGNQPSLQADGKNVLMFAPITFQGHESDVAITVSFSNPHTGEMTEADIIINSLHSFATLDSAIDPNKEQSSCSGTIDPSSCDGHYDLENVITHEIGHFHGLGEDYDDNQASMFSCTSACESHKRSLNDSDISAINQLYSGMQLEAHNTGECAWIPERGPQTPGKAACIFLVLAALLRRARRRS